MSGCEVMSRSCSSTSLKDRRQRADWPAAEVRKRACQVQEEVVGWAELVPHPFASVSGRKRGRSDFAENLQQLFVESALRKGKEGRKTAAKTIGNCQI